MDFTISFVGTGVTDVTGLQLQAAGSQLSAFSSQPERSTPLVIPSKARDLGFARITTISERKHRRFI
jgi:hypothetical protein